MILNEKQIRWVLAGVGLGFYVLILSLEIVTEQDDIEFFDVLVDAVALLLTIGSAVGVALLVQRMHIQHEEKLALLRDLDVARTQGDNWRSKVQSHMAGIRIEMEKQFDEWGMTAAEQEIGMLILKGLSHKEVASLRGTSEATVRQQAQSIYGKSNLPGKTAFSAYFLEDVFSPQVVPDGLNPPLPEGSREVSLQGK